jgi:hypothetical protein
MAAEEMELWKFANFPNFANACADCSIYCCMNVDWSQQLLKGLFEDHTWEWIVSYWKDIYGLENSLDLVHE